MANMLAFAKEYKNSTKDYQKKVFWTNESFFEIAKSPGQIRVWRKAYEKYSDKCLAPIFKSGRTQVLVLDAFSGFDKATESFGNHTSK